MSSYYPAFDYMGINSLVDKNLIVTHFESGDTGEMDTFLGMDPVYTDIPSGAKRIDYGAKYNSVAVIRISVMKADGTDFSLAEVRDFLAWTTGAKNISYLNLVGFVDGSADDASVYASFLGRITSVYQQKINARTVGFVIEHTSISPWAYTVRGQRTLSLSSATTTYTITNDSDDWYNYIYLHATISSTTGGTVRINNTTLGEETVITNVAVNETVTIDDNQIITSDKPSRVFGSDFNFVWPKLAPGVNTFTLTTSGRATITIEYRIPIKIGDCAMDFDENTDMVCLTDLFNQ